MTENAYTIREAAERTGVSAHTLRYYERSGLMQPPTRRASGHRRYSDDDLGWIHMLTLLRATGRPIAGMLRFAALIRQGDLTVPELLEFIKAHEGEVIARLDELERHLGALRKKIGFYENIVAEGLKETA